jgi:hypothetical protein
MVEAALPTGARPRAMPDVCSLEVGGARLEVDARAGGRVTSLRLGGVEVLSGPDVDPDNYGSTFWTSPQSDWGWPPPAEIDRGPYELTLGPDEVTLRGAANERLGVRVKKRIAVDRARLAFVVAYDVENVGALPVACAPWEVTRVRAGGIALFPAGAPPSGSLLLDERGGFAWFAHDPTVLSLAGKKAFAGGEGGVLAYAYGRLLYVKTFDRVPLDRQAPGEGTIEVYANSRYVELELQGCYAPIEPGATASWAVTWYVRELPRDVDPRVGSPDLAAFVGRVVR